MKPTKEAEANLGKAKLPTRHNEKWNAFRRKSCPVEEKLPLARFSINGVGYLPIFFAKKSYFAPPLTTDFVSSSSTDRLPGEESPPSLENPVS
jgi:hypothetical protein